MREPVKKSKLTKLRRRFSRGFQALHGRLLRYEPLEDRRLLSITVNTLVDENNGIGVGGISLRDAIAAASPGDTISFAPSLFNDGPATTQLTNGQLVIDKPLTINGPGRDKLTVDGSLNPSTDQNGGIFQVTASNGSTTNNVAISGLTLTGGHGAYFGGAIYNLENLTITGCSLTSNSTTFGGAIYSTGGLTIIDSQFLSNLASFEGGAIDSVGALTIQNSLISGNSVFNGFGGGIVAYGDTTLTSSTVSNNSATATGGGIQSAHSSLSIMGCTLSGNSAGTIGGALYIQAPSAAGEEVTIQNSAITANAAGTAGGIFADLMTISLTQVTIAQNHASIAGGIELLEPVAAVIRCCTIADNTAAQFGGGILVTGPSDAGGGQLTLESTIVAGNAGNFGLGADIAALFNPTINATYSLIGSNAGSGLTATQGVPDANGNLIGGNGGLNPEIDPMLSELALHGGTTLNYALLPGSPAINRGNPAAIAGVGSVPQFDQRNLPYVRVVGGRIDIGAFESQNLTPLSLVVDTLVDEDDGNFAAGDLSLREAIGLANARQYSLDTISFAPALTASGPATILLTQGELDITDGITITGPSGNNKLTIDASGNDPTPNINEGNGSRVMQMTPEDMLLGMAVTINNLTLTGGDISDFHGGGAILAQGSLTLNSCFLTGNNSLGTGGAIAMPSGDLTVSSSTISGNSTQSNGGGIYTFGNATISNSTLSGNSAQYGGAIYATKAIDRGTQVTITGTTIENNSATAGSGIHANGSGVTFTSFVLSLNIVQSTISGNGASGGIAGTGGGIFTQEVTTEIDNSTISGNASSAAGAGATFYDSAVTIRNSTITKNAAQTSVSGIHTKTSTKSQIQIQSSIVAGNIGTNSDIDSGSIGSFVSLGYNLVGPGATSPFNQPGDQVTSDAKLGPLANNGGPTKTHALLVGSPAIDAGDPTAVAGVGGVPATDQRGAPFTRVFNGDGIGTSRIDIGAFELQTAANASSGDYNHNGKVDATDYILWRNTKGATGVPAFSGADGDGDGMIGTGDYNVWRSHFGNSAAAGGDDGDEAVLTLASGESSPGVAVANAAQGDIQIARAIDTKVAAVPNGSLISKSDEVSRRTDWHTLGNASQSTSNDADTALLEWLAGSTDSGFASRSRHIAASLGSTESQLDESAAELADCGLSAVFASNSSGRSGRF